ncbi:MAG TPA: prolyl oligopeptidase family serine peptidase [Casimicrobiaceae bacterium]|nr:prolyl oligopeptidase family serine peptidase [Casimicrobiaceae bacterium]
MLLRSSIVVALLLGSATSGFAAEFVPPPTPSRPVVETLHGVTLTDRYRWLENAKDPEVERWTRAQHAATLEWLKENAPPIAGLRDELTKLIDRDVTRPPFFKMNREFFLHTRKGEAQPKLYTRIGGEERLLFDPLALDPSGKTTLGGVVLSRDGSKAAVATYARGSEIRDFRVIDTLSGHVIGEPIIGIRSFAWARDERYAFISPRTAESDARQEPMRCYRHRLGSGRAGDELLMTMKDAKEWCAVYEPEDADVTVFENGDFFSNTVRIRPLGSSEPPRTIWSSTKSRALFTWRRDRFYARTNDAAPNWKVMVGQWERPESNDWQTLIAEGKVVLEHFEATSDHLVVLDKENVLTRVVAYDRNGTRMREMPAPVLGNVSGLFYDIDANRLYAGLTSFTAPGRVYALDGRALDWKLIWQDNPPQDTSRIVAKQMFVAAKDGARIPIFVVHRDDVVLDGSAPALLHAYGGFNRGIAPFYVSTLGSFINRGGVFIEAGIRGGNEYGERWHEQGMQKAKQTSFDDFFAVAEWLVANRYTRPARLAAQGGSNGGLLIGAALTQRPDLFAAALCQVPLLDMLRYHRFLIARFWIPEYGDPDNAADFAALFGYSPYHRLPQGVNLPPTLVTAGEYDSRVDPLHAKKFVAAVQNNVGQQSPFMLYMDFDSGHGGGKPRQKVIDDREIELRFLLHALKMK